MVAERPPAADARPGRGFVAVAVGLAAVALLVPSNDDGGAAGVAAPVDAVPRASGVLGLWAGEAAAELHGAADVSSAAPGPAAFLVRPHLGPPLAALAAAGEAVAGGGARNDHHGHAAPCSSLGGPYCLVGGRARRDAEVVAVDAHQADVLKAGRNEAERLAQEFLGGNSKVLKEAMKEADRIAKSLSKNPLIGRVSDVTDAKVAQVFLGVRGMNWLVAFVGSKCVGKQEVGECGAYKTVLEESAKGQLKALRVGVLVIDCMDSLFVEFCKRHAVPTDVTYHMRLYPNPESFYPWVPEASGGTGRPPTPDELAAWAEKSRVVHTSGEATVVSVSKAPEGLKGTDRPAGAPVISLVSREPRLVSFVNEARKPLDIYWADFEGVEHRYLTISPGESHLLSSFVGHVWAVRDSSTGVLISHVIVTAPNGPDAQLQTVILR